MVHTLNGFPLLQTTHTVDRVMVCIDWPLEGPPKATAETRIEITILSHDTMYKALYWYIPPHAQGLYSDTFYIYELCTAG